MEEDQPNDGVVDPHCVVEAEDWDQRHLQRHHEQRDHDDKEPVAAGELEPRERVRGKGRDQDREERGPDRDLTRGQERVQDRGVVEDRVVVRPGQFVRCREHLPPAFDLEVDRR